MLKELLITTALLAPAFAATAQTRPAAPASAPAAAVTAPVAGLTGTPGKKTQVARILKSQQTQIENLARAMAERPAFAILEGAEKVLATNIAPDKREAVGKEIQADTKKYLDEAVPLVRDRAIKLAPQTIGAMLEQKFSEEELRQLADFLSSPVYAKYQPMGADMQKNLMDKLLADTRGAVEPKVIALDQSVARRLGVSSPGKGAAPAGPGAAPAPNK